MWPIKRVTKKELIERGYEMETDIRYAGGYFTHSELACKGTGIVQLADGFERELESLRIMYNKPILVTSCCRSAVHNDRVRGHPRSLHVYDENHWGLNGAAAIDVLVGDKPELVEIALSRGWSVGVHKSFIHLDRRDLAGLSQAVFGY